MIKHMKSLSFASLALCAVLFLPAKASDLVVFGQFIAVRTATDKCGSPDTNTRNSFESNYSYVKQLALVEMKNLDSGLSNKEATKKIEEGEEKGKNATYEIIAEKGCSDSYIQDLVTLYPAMASLKQ